MNFYDAAPSPQHFVHAKWLTPATDYYYTIETKTYFCREITVIIL
jgi:hypothetical protein